MPTLEMPLRERHRIQTWRAIHEAAATLALQEGFAGATIEAIAARAEVSRRTFFNYFPTKEDAVLGTNPPELTADDLAEFARSDVDPFARIIHLMVSVLRSAMHDAGAFELRRELVRRSPELRARLDKHMRDSEALVLGALLEGAPGLPDSLRSEHASRALAMVAGVVVRFAYTPHSDGTIADGPESIDLAIAQFREVLTELL